MVSVVGAVSGVVVIGVAFPVRRAGYGLRFRSFNAAGSTGLLVGSGLRRTNEPARLARPHGFPIFLPPEEAEMSLIQATTPPGVMELLPREQIAFQRMLDTIRAQLRAVRLPAGRDAGVRAADVLLTKSRRRDREAGVLRPVDRRAGARRRGAGVPELALRFDLTVPLARYVAEHEHELDLPVPPLPDPARLPRRARRRRGASASSTSATST